MDTIQLASKCLLPLSPESLFCLSLSLSSPPTWSALGRNRSAQPRVARGSRGDPRGRVTSGERERDRALASAAAAAEHGARSRSRVEWNARTTSRGQWERGSRPSWCWDGPLSSGPPSRQRMAKAKARLRARARARGPGATRPAASLENLTRCRAVCAGEARTL